jgi:hypothetical protein
MIPLSRWLAERQSPAQALHIPDGLEEPACPMPALEIETDTVNAAAQREEELLASLREAEERLEQQVLARAARERELETRLGEDLSRTLQAGIAKATGSLLGMIEESLAMALAPLLEEQARSRSIAELTELIRRELRQADTPVLEIRAPSHLHDALRPLAGEAGISMTMTESACVEVVLAAERRRFEDLSSRWLDAIRERLQ